MQRSRNSKGRFTPSKPIDVRTVPEAKEAEKSIQVGPITLVLVYADWCGHCHTYLPTWKELEDTPNRSANIIKVHHDMIENIPAIKNSKIQGYPSVIKVHPDGKIEEYDVPGTNEKTNAMPMMRDMAKMRAELTNAAIMVPNRQVGGETLTLATAFLTAFQNVGPSALLLAAHNTLPKKKTYKSPKKASRRASTRKVRR